MIRIYTFIFNAATNCCDGDAGANRSPVQRLILAHLQETTVIIKINNNMANTTAIRNLPKL